MHEKPAGLDPEFVTVNEASRLLSLGKTKTFELIRTGALDTTKCGKKRLVRLRSIRNFGRTA
jgi:excisionase family DNA binding protein